MSCVRLQGFNGRDTGGKRCGLRSGRPSSTLFVMTLAERSFFLNIPRALGRLQSLNSVTEITVAYADAKISRV